ncbi:MULTISPECIES: hypothetical protein [unclassified Streptomyces]|uniref:hypothetical protein n=1 Tax=unclassified Streptomyces TaxID=2593676 RepID=UPI000938FAA3|nr:hypothetical protein [Streptomyces sp. TSRI0281]OKI35026.1 hypothetical protein A6A29_16525 [Streptomyces sp. TSRI0281]
MTNIKPINLAHALDPWERQPKESPKRYTQFCDYRDQGRKRTLARSAESLALAPGYVREVAAAFKWRDRVEAYDRQQDREYDALWVEERRKAAEHDAKILGAAVGKLAQRLGSLDANSLTNGDFIKLMDVAMRHRRALFGDPAATIAITGQGGGPLAVHLTEFAEMPPEQRRVRLAHLTASVDRRLRAVNGEDDEDEYLDDSGHDDGEEGGDGS